ncbi:PREDICTED: arylsulfatase-like [Priapulus caudatus]|uniref:Arylsulfatase-like n=1 Tax=Priapulus caudatus TaxID=37621 RepID=A0ABM1DYM0_PRICU|nr:PREDICTED: arylsulfatase-like [Priapulus caudatus]
MHVNSEFYVLLAVLVAAFSYVASSTCSDSRPNIVLILADDMGWGDLSVYGHPSQEWGRIDQMAAEGMRFTNFYSASSMCSPSRASILTGRVPPRTGVWNANYSSISLFGPMDSTGLPAEELTIAEVLREAGYRTGMVGKWHLGTNQYNSSDGVHLPHHHGFDYVGTSLPFSMTWHCDEHQIHIPKPPPFCFLYRGAELVQQPIDMHHMTESIVEDAVSFIEDNVDRKFFLYLSLTHTHIDLTVTPRFHKSSARGRYGDNVNEMQWVVGTVLDTLQSRHLQENTLVFFVSDNGPDVNICEEGGSPGILRGGKGKTWDGGIRVPAVAYWPCRIQAGHTSKAILSTTDLLPTFAELARKQLPTDITIDGKSMSSVLFDGSATSHEILYFYCADVLMAVRYGNYKIHFRSQSVSPPEYYDDDSTCVNGVPQDFPFLCYDCEGDCVTSHDPPLYFDIENDPGERWPLGENKIPEEVLLRVASLVFEHKKGMVARSAEIGSEPLDPSLQPCCNPPACTCNYPGKI